MINFKSPFRFNKQERSGIFFLALIIALLQLTNFMFKWEVFGSPDPLMVIDEELEEEILALHQRQRIPEEPNQFKFNPNYMDDHKAYQLGMSVSEIDRLIAFRNTNSYISSAEEFQRVTLVSDSLLKAIQPYFRFPEGSTFNDKFEKNSEKDIQKRHLSVVPIKEANLDLNKATADELKRVYGVGEVLSKRIVKFRNALGGFLVEEQLLDVYGLKPEVVDRIIRRYKVIEQPSINKIRLNSATADELAKLLYINRKLAAKIIAYRENSGSFDSLNELTKIAGFPEDKIDRIKLYLTL